VSILPPILGVIVGTIAIFYWRRTQARKLRSKGLNHLLDLADEMEKLLNLSQQRMQSMQSVLERVPSDIGALASASLDSNDKIKAVKRDLLQHRLWIQQNGETATQQEIDQACAALERSRDRISQQINALEAAGADLLQATANNELNDHEPASLRRRE
jgi:hypothetical protein